MEFRKHKIIRTCKKSYSNYTSYKPFLKEDFCHRCAYCNLCDTDITTYFEVDHFVPKAIFMKTDGREYLEYDYANLIYSCPNCNRAKSDLYSGDIINRPYDNDSLYDPVKTNYNDIFYRDKHGTISSHDLKGKEMIIALKLYRPIHNLAWICEQLKELSQELGDKIENETDSSKKSILLEAHYKLLQYHQKCYCIFIANYNNNESIMQKIYKI